ncbi:MAG: carbohydrate ABC transporter permease [Chloroflexota bacterium]|nr:carbohydrate ABC transporter permease [Chloroflexota bacterium]
MTLASEETVVQDPTVLTTRRGERRPGSWLGQALTYLLLILGATIMIIPFIWMVATSLKPGSEILKYTFLPQEPTLQNYQEVLFGTRFPTWYINSIIVAIISTTSVVIFDSLAGYTFAKFEFPLKNLWFILILSTLMVPTEMLIIPWFQMAVKYGWNDTFWGIAFPGVITAAGLFLMRQFMQGVPDELMDAARIDGMNELGIFLRIAVPLVKPAIAALAIFNFLGNWNAYIWPLIVASTQAKFTLPVGLAFFSGESGSDWELIMTGATLATIPLLIVFMIFQRQIIRGIALTGLKG